MDKEKLIAMLEEFVTPNKVKLIEKVLSHRTRYLTIVLEDIYQEQNASAVIRTCDCFGIQDLYITEDLHAYNLNPNVVKGASKWIDIHRYERGKASIEQCFVDLRQKGYRLVGTTPDTNTRPIQDLELTQKTAVVFGTEKRGMSDFAKSHVDELVHIPMLGFTESFNISVSAALLINELSSRLRQLEIHWQLSKDEINNLKYRWYQQIVKRSDLLINNYLKEHS